MRNQSCIDVPIPPPYESEYYWDSSGYLAMNIPALAPGATWRLPLAFWRSLRWTSGSYEFVALADSDQIVRESNEVNNRSPAHPNVSTMVVP